MPVHAVKGKIAPSHQAAPGKALCTWRGAGWGELVRKDKFAVGRFDENLLLACERLIREWNPTVEWVTCIPSLRHPDLVPDFARRLAERLGLPFEVALVKTGNRPEQKTMANSILQARNIDGALAIANGPIPSGPVLLVDDMVDSRWTITVASWLLRSNGSGKVFPFALALT